MISIINEHSPDLEDLREVDKIFENLGFANGFKDYQTVGRQFELLQDWFYMNKSLNAQRSAYVLL